MFDHTKDNVFTACGTNEKDVKEAFDALPDNLHCKSELIEQMCRAGDDPAQNLAVWLAFCEQDYQIAKIVKNAR